MITPLTRWIPAASLALVSACVPILPHIDFVPAMDGGIIVKDHCWGIPSVEYKIDGIRLAGRIITWPDNRLRVEMRIAVPEGRVVTLQSPALTVASPPGAEAKLLTIAGISPTGNPSLPLDPLGPLLGRDVHVYDKRFARNFWLFIPLDGIDTNDFLVSLPPLAIDRQIVNIPPIRFTRETRIQLIAPVQC